MLSSDFIFCKYAQITIKRIYSLYSDRHSTSLPSETQSVVRDCGALAVMRIHTRTERERESSLDFNKDEKRI